MRDATLRKIVHLSVGGAGLRVHLSNAFGTAPLHFTSVHIARPERLLPVYDSGDHLHLSPAGYRVMGETVPLSRFTGR